MQTAQEFAGFRRMSKDSDVSEILVDSMEMDCESEAETPEDTVEGRTVLVTNIHNRNTLGLAAQAHNHDDVRKRNIAEDCLCLRNVSADRAQTSKKRTFSDVAMSNINPNDRPCKPTYSKSSDDIHRGNTEDKKTLAKKQRMTIPNQDVLQDGTNKECLELKASSLHEDQDLHVLLLMSKEQAMELLASSRTVVASTMEVEKLPNVNIKVPTEEKKIADKASMSADKGKKVVHKLKNTTKCVHNIESFTNAKGVIEVHNEVNCRDSQSLSTSTKEAGFHSQSKDKVDINKLLPELVAAYRRKKNGNLKDVDNTLQWDSFPTVPEKLRKISRSKKYTELNEVMSEENSEYDSIDEEASSNGTRLQRQNTKFSSTQVDNKDKSLRRSTETKKRPTNYQIPGVSRNKKVKLHPVDEEYNENITDDTNNTCNKNIGVSRGRREVSVKTAISHVGTKHTPTSTHTRILPGHGASGSSAQDDIADHVLPNQVTKHSPVSASIKDVDNYVANMIVCTEQMRRTLKHEYKYFSNIIKTFSSDLDDMQNNQLNCDSSTDDKREGARQNMDNTNADEDNGDSKVLRCLLM